jgi:two-component sensor histidine kinase
MASLGTLAAGLGHDLANLLLPIRMRLDAIECPGEKGAAAEDIGAIREALKYLQRLSEGMRLLAQDPESGSGTNEALEIRAWWRDVERVIRSVVPREIELNADIPDVPLRVPVARHRLTQAVFNLVQNSVEAMSGRGSGRVQVWAKRLSAESSAAGAPAVQVGVTDDGPGMSGEVLARCFEPYFSTKGRAISTGMGLGLVRAVVERSGGKIIATSTPNQATTFVLEFPESVGPDRSGASGRHGAPRAAVALVEGRTSAHARMILRSFGFDVTEGPPQRAPSPPVLWLTDRAEIDSLADFVRDSSSRHVLVYDSGSGARQGIAAESSRVVYLGRNPSPSVVRAAISRVVNAIEKPSIES